MKLELFNTLTRKREIFKPLQENEENKEVKMYTCGPTVYNYAHIGNLRSFLFEDFLKRTLLFNNFKVKHVQNITDVGHLTSDADTGEDKMLKGAKRENKTVWEIAEFYTQSYKNDIKKLNILKPDIWCRATDHITEQIELIKKLEKKGFTYQAGGNVYFNTSKVKDYGKLAQLDLNALSAEKKARVEKDQHKKNEHDFVLWFTKSKFENQEMKWKSPWGEGYPGWHIECSAMSMKYLGEQFDIHCGGIDHIPVHHTNEIAQSESATGKKPWVKYWLHNEFLVLNAGEKMAKSGSNFITLATLEQKGFSPLDYRYFCLGTHYRKPLMFSWEAMENARNAHHKLVEKILELRAEAGKKSGKENSKTKNSVNNSSESYLEQFNSNLNEDLNTSMALATMWEVIKDENFSASEKLTLLFKFDEVFGFGLEQLKKKKVMVPAELSKLIKEREKARQDKNWKLADELRDKIQKKGYLIKDTKDGFEIVKS